jgi:hypothetical protein
MTFRRHAIEMTLSMVLPWSVFFVVARVVLPAAGIEPALVILMPFAIAAMVLPMTGWMLYRGHAGRDILEMNASMFAGMLVVLPAVRIVLPAMGVSLGLEAIFPIALVAMTAPMLALMYFRRERHAHHARHANP